jgi:hypothetical protein
MNTNVKYILNIVQERFTYTGDEIHRIWNSAAFKTKRMWTFKSFVNNTYKFSKPSHYQNLQNFQMAFNPGTIGILLGPITFDNNEVGREWVIDVDTDNQAIDEDFHVLVNNVVYHMFKLFYGDDATLCFSGNKGLHIWLNDKKFPLNATADVRKKYANLFQSFARCDVGDSIMNTNFDDPQSITTDKPFTLLKCFYQAILIDNIQENIAKFIINGNTMNSIVKEIWRKINIDINLFVSPRSNIRCKHTINDKSCLYATPINDNEAVSNDNRCFLI